MSFPCVLITWKLLLKSNPEGHAGRRWPFPEGHWSLGREDESTSCENRPWHGLVMGGGPVLWGGLPGERNWSRAALGLPRKSESGRRLWAATLEGRGLGVRRQPSGEMEAAVRGVSRAGEAG